MYSRKILLMTGMVASLCLTLILVLNMPDDDRMALAQISVQPTPTRTPTPLPPTPTFTPTPTPWAPPAIESLEEYVLSLNLKQSLQGSLVKKLDEAYGALTDDNPNNDHVATNKLQDFIAQVNAQRGKGISDDAADKLVASAQAILNQLEN